MSVVECILGSSKLQSWLDQRSCLHFHFDDDDDTNLQQSFIVY